MGISVLDITLRVFLWKSSKEDSWFFSIYYCCRRSKDQHTLSVRLLGRSELTDRNVELYPQFFLELITTQLRFNMVSPQIVLLNKYLFLSILQSFCLEIEDVATWKWGSFRTANSALAEA